MGRTVWTWTRHLLTENLANSICKLLYKREAKFEGQAGYTSAGPSEGKTKRADSRNRDFLGGRGLRRDRNFE